MKVKFRTVLLVFLFIKLCILFTVLQETVESLSSNDHPQLFGTNDFFLFDMMLICVSGVSVLLSGFLIILFAIGHTRIRKPIVVVAFGINMVFVIPFFASGLYLKFQDSNGLKLTERVSQSFDVLHKYSSEYNAELRQVSNTTKPNITTKPQKGKPQKNSTVKINRPKVVPEMIKNFETVEHIQKRYCCCGLTGGKYYGWDNATTSPKMSIPFTSKLDIRCPHNSLFKNSTCIDSHLIGCETRLKSVYPTRILIYSSIGISFSILFAVVAPFIYSQFELDRRRARSKYIRDWRSFVEHHVNDHRMWALRNADPAPPPPPADVKPSPVSANSAKSAKTNSKESLNQQKSN